jgi:hypothetical protein
MSVVVARNWKFFGKAPTATSFLNLRRITEDHTLQTGQMTSDSGVVIPAGTFIWALAIKVITTITGPATFDYGFTTDRDAFGSGISVAQNTRHMTDAGLPAIQRYNESALTVGFQAGSNFTAGVVRIDVWLADTEI